MGQGEKVKLKIIKIEKKSRWDFWRISTHNITVECDDIRKHFMLYKNLATSAFLLVHFCKNKCLGLDQSVRFTNDDWKIICDEFERLFQNRYDVSIDQLIGVTLKV
jgi:hypothetical protein